MKLAKYNNSFFVPTVNHDVCPIKMVFVKVVVVHLQKNVFAHLFIVSLLLSIPGRFFLS
jgi:hypothetical protein